MDDCRSRSAVLSGSCMWSAAAQASGKVARFYLSVGSSMTVWNLPCRAPGPSPTSMYWLPSRSGEFIWTCVRAWASSSVRSLLDGDDTNKDLGRDKEP